MSQTTLTPPPAEVPTRDDRFELPIVYAYPTTRWSDFSGRQFALTRAMAARARVVFLEIAAEDGRRIDLRRPTATVVASGVAVVRHAFALRNSGLGRRLPALAARIDAAWLHTLLRSIGVHEYVYWVSVCDPRLLAGMQLDRMVYDCIDPCFTVESQARHDAIEFAFARRAKLVFCTAEALLDRLRPINARCVLLPNAAPDGPNRWPATVALPAALAGRSPPIVGFMGTVDWRFDVRFVAELARALPAGVICIVGRVNADQAQRVAALRAMPNVVFTGSVDNAEGDRLVASFDVGLIPFLPGPIGDGVNPVKMYMYLAAGKPVLATNTRECARHAPLVRVAEDGLAAAALVPSLLAIDPAAARRFAAGETWSYRAAHAVHALHDTFLTPESS